MSSSHTQPTITTAAINRIENRIKFVGHFSKSHIRRALSVIYETIEKCGYKDVVLDFSKVETAFQDSMVFICLRCAHEREINNIDFEVALPENDDLRKLFVNSAWESTITGQDYRPYTTIIDHVPLQIFKTPEEQCHAVNRLVESILRTAGSIERPSLSAIEWALGEITDNVITHSESMIGGAVQLTVYSKKVQFVVADLGVGIPKTLKRTAPNINNDKSALQSAIKEGVTRDKKIGQGNGLYGSFEVSRNSGRDFYLASGRATLELNIHGQVRIDEERLPINGTLVAGSIGLDDPDILHKALKFSGKPYIPTDYIELNYECDESDRVILFTIKDKVHSTSARSGSEQIRTQIKNLMHMHPGRILLLDFTGLSIISSSFADEIIGKLVVEIGFCTFVNRISFRGQNDIICSIIQRAVMQRFAEANRVAFENKRQ